MKPLFIQYERCGTCQKAAKWLKTNHIEVETRSIVEQNPNKEELEEWIAKSKLTVAKFFNTSGKLYKEHQLKDVVKTASADELITLLSSNGMLVKRPILIAKYSVLVGFNPTEWEELFNADGV